MPFFSFLFNTLSIELNDGKLKSFLDATKDLSADERGHRLEIDGALSTAHEESALQGQTEAPSRDEKVDLHFIALVAKNGSLYQLGKSASFQIDFLFLFVLERKHTK